MPEGSAPPRATYRLQLRAEFGFDDAAEIADYLARLGISHVYTSPYLQAAEGSTHGYDVVDHSQVSAELGGAEAHARFVTRLADLGLGQVVDIVPNHMAIGSARNRWWWDVLENGPSSRYAGHFDVDWDPPESKLRNRVLMPVLGDQYGRVLERGEIRVTWDDDGRFRVRYFDHELPAAPRSLVGLLRRAAERCLAPDADHLAFIAHSLDRLPVASSTDRAANDVRHRDKEVLYAQLARLTSESSGALDAVRTEVASLNADVDALDDFLDRQNYRLAYWRTAGEELDYRRFFDIATLAGLRVEVPEVFADTHRLVLAWVADGEVAGLRVDHPDGLHDPGAYMAMLRSAAPDAWIVVEKILEPGETLPRRWPVDGTTGYDFCASVTRVLHDERGIGPLRHVYEEAVGEPIDLEVREREAKLAVLSDALAADVSRVTNLFVETAEQHRRWRDFTRSELRTALVEVAAGYDVYRSYVGPEEPAGPVDVGVIGRAVQRAAAHHPELDPEVFEFLARVLRGSLDDGSGTARDLRMRFQQLTGPVMAKGVEDTVLYDVVPLASWNEVGASPAIGAIGVDELHAEMADRTQTLPRSMLTLSTHDTKRSEDVRARLAVLSELPGAWGELVRRWDDGLVSHRVSVDGVVGWPDARMEQLLLQTLVGAHPIETERVVAYMEKASREAGRHTSWIDPVGEYDAALASFVESVCGDDELMALVASFADEIVEPGRRNSLAQKLICLTAPGVPDVYQGTELWDLSLVDPDNRRPVDYGTRRRLLERAASMSPEQRWDAVDDGTPKLWTVHRALAVRAAHPEWFDGASYEPLPLDGAADRHAIAYLRGRDVAVVVPRLPVGLGAAGGWSDTTVELPAATWWDELGERSWPGGRIPVAELLSTFPVALLHTDVPDAGGGG